MWILKEYEHNNGSKEDERVRLLLTIQPKKEKQFSGGDSSSSCSRGGLGSSRRHEVKTALVTHLEAGNDRLTVLAPGPPLSLLYFSIFLCLNKELEG